MPSKTANALILGRFPQFQLGMTTRPMIECKCPTAGVRRSEVFELGRSGGKSDMAVCCWQSFVDETRLRIMPSCCRLNCPPILERMTARILLGMIWNSA
jgi:hypothetical protein